MNKLSIETRIGIIVFAALLFGIIAEFNPFAFYAGSSENFNILGYAISLLSPLRLLSFFRFDFFEYSDYENNLHLNFLRITLYAILLVGGILYISSKQKESRLIRFFFSFVLINNVVWFLFILLSLLNVTIRFHSVKIFWSITAILIDLAWIFLSYWILTKFHKTKALENISSTPDEPNSNFFLEASNWQRFFHLVIDTIICVLIFSGFVSIFGGNLLEKLVSKTGEKTVLYLLLLIFRLIYYPFWETLFGATPAKFLTETRVLNLDGTKIDFTKALMRTLSRFIPFEPLSFFGSAGWHDNLTQTQVVSEKRTGMHGGLYFLIIPLFLILGFGSYYGHEAYKDHQSYIYAKCEYDQNIITIANALKNLSSNHLIKIKNVESYSSNNPYLKVEKIKDDNVLVSVILENRSNYSDQLHYAQSYYKYYNDTLKKMVIKKSLLAQAYTESYDDYIANRKKRANLLIDGKNYEIECIDLLYAPKLEIGGYSSFSGDNVSLSIKNSGWSANLIEIKNLEGSIKWINHMPQRIESVSGYVISNSLTLQGENYKRNQKYKVKLVVEDSIKRRQTYILEGKNSHNTLTKENE